MALREESRCVLIHGGGRGGVFSRSLEPGHKCHIVGRHRSAALLPLLECPRSCSGICPNDPLSLLAVSTSGTFHRLRAHRSAPADARSDRAGVHLAQCRAAENPAPVVRHAARHRSDHGLHPCPDLPLHFLGNTCTHHDANRRSPTTAHRLDGRRGAFSHGDSQTFLGRLVEDWFDRTHRIVRWRRPAHVDRGLSLPDSARRDYASMNPAIDGLVLLILSVSSLQAAELSPQAFAFGLPINMATQAAAYRFTVPLAVYQNTFRDDLADLRVFNAQSESVPYSLRQKAPPTNRATDTQLPLFRLPSGSRVVIDGVRVTIDSPGSAVNLQTETSSAANASASQYILDGRTLSASVVGLRLEWLQ